MPKPIIQPTSKPRFRLQHFRWNSVKVLLSRRLRIGMFHFSCSVVRFQLKKISQVLVPPIRFAVPSLEGPPDLHFAIAKIAQSSSSAVGNSVAYAGWRCLPMGRFGGGLGAGRREAPKWADIAGLRCPVREAGGWLKRSKLSGGLLRAPPRAGSESPTLGGRS